MSLAASSRAVLRQSTFAVRRAGVRNASSTSEAATAAKETAANVQSKATEGLTRVTSQAGSAISKAGSAANGVLNSLASAGGRTGRLIGRIQSMIPPTIYYSKVALEVGRIVVRERKMSPPDVATFQTYYKDLFTKIRSGKIFQQAESAGAQPQNILNRVRNMSSAQWTGVGIVVAEVIGFFTVGEMIGKWKVVGYRSDAAPAQH